MMNRPFKVSFCDIKNHYANHLECILQEINKTIFNDFVDIEIAKISQSKSFLEVLSNFDKYDDIYQCEVIDKFISDYPEVDGVDQADLNFGNSKLVTKDKYMDNIEIIERYQYLINKISSYNKQEKIDFFHEFKAIKDKKSVDIDKIVNLENLDGRSISDRILGIVFLIKFHDPTYARAYDILGEYFHISKPASLTLEEFNELKRLMMTVYDCETHNLYQMKYEDTDIIKTYLFEYGFENKNYKFLDTLLNNKIPKEWLEEKEVIKINKFCIDLKRIGELLQTGTVSWNVVKNLLERPELNSIKLQVIAILNRCNLTLEDLLLLSKEGLGKLYLDIDRNRANIQGETQSILYDPNHGHWEVYEDSVEYSFSEATTSVDGFYARNPILDVKEGAICAIDFGTKSTVVAIRDQEEVLLRIGTGDYFSEVRKTDYENPTTIYFDNFFSFINSYQTREGRPFTNWKDLKISHEAEQRFFNDITNEDNFYATFSELKQWANDSNRYQIIRDRQGEEFRLVPYKKLENENNFDPIELYAYYLGLYINNMTNGIYLNYILSFPVNYGKEVQDKLLASFTKGLRKSLPTSILNNEELMEDFDVYAGASEPAAYAISALEMYSLEPTSDDEIAYGVFDFGGGTTDYDFGIEVKPTDGRRRFELTQFGKGGDPYLGGENLLQLLAYKVYIENKIDMLKNRIPIVLPPKAEKIPGYELLVMSHDVATKEAYSNIRVLMHLLRPIWEEIKDAEDEFNEGFKTVRLFPIDKQEMHGIDISLKINIESLKELLKEHIAIGVKNFINQMYAVFNKKKLKSYPIHIFLAGNSCKSSILQEIFIHTLVDSVKDFINTHKDESDIENLDLYKLYPPLGTNFAFNKIEKLFNEDDLVILRRILVDTSSLNVIDNNTPLNQIRTGKTGVVFGLLRSRKGGKDVRINNENLTDIDEIKFPFYLGVEGDNRMFKTVISIDIPYNTWAPFDWADEKRFELYYTVDNRALYDNTLPISETSLKVCKIDKADINEEHKIFIRKVGINLIEYVVADTDFNGDTTNLHVYSNVILG